MSAPGPEPASDRVSTIELFFDLVFVFTITQVAEVIVHHPDIAGIGHAVLELSVLGWMFGGYAWLTNSASGASPSSVRILLLLGMAAFFVCALAVPHAFDEDGIIFGIGYLVINLIHLGGLLLGRTKADAVVRLAPFNLSSAGLILAAGFVHGPLDWVLWSGTIVLMALTPFLARASRGFTLSPIHFAERHGLMILIVLGESLVSVGLAAAATASHVTPELMLGALSGLAATMAMWWAYFVGEDERAAEAHAKSSDRQRTNQGLLGYGVAHLVMIFGPVAIAAATKLSLRELLSPMPMFGAMLMAAGCGLYLAGGAMFRWALRYASPLPRLGGVLLSVAVIPAGLYGSAAAALAAVSLVIFAIIAIERATESGAIERAA